MHLITSISKSRKIDISLNFNKKYQKTMPLFFQNFYLKFNSIILLLMHLTKIHLYDYYILRKIITNHVKMLKTNLII